MSFNFTMLEKGKYGGFTSLTGKVLRLQTKGMSLSNDATLAFGAPSKTDGGDDRLELSIEFDNVQQAIKLTRDMNGNGYAFFRKSEGGTFHMNMGKYMQGELSSMPKGDYTASPDEPNIFVLAR